MSSSTSHGQAGGAAEFDIELPSIEIEFGSPELRKDKKYKNDGERFWKYWNEVATS
jgi:hypothetical protein